MASADTPQEIVRALRNTNEPAMSAADLADKIGVSVKTINNHTPALVEEEKIRSTQIGNATAYFLASSDLPAHKKPDHTCSKCGREISESNDFAKIDYTRYFDDGGKEPSVVDFYIVCRFCYSDFVSWMFNDIGSIGEYSDVHSWYIPEDQLNEVRDDPDILTKPSLDYVDEEPKRLLELIENLEEKEDEEERLWVDDVLDAAMEDGMREFEASKALEALRSIGLVHQRSRRVRTAK